jgi:DNA-binding LacI/PurR family transcriptional regulator
MIHRVTLSDMAREVGVSAKTVSEALRGKGGVADETARRIHEAAEKLGYAADPRARRRSATIGICIPDLGGYYADLAHSVIRLASDWQFAVYPAFTGDSAIDERRTAQLFKRHNVDAVVLTSSRIGDQFFDEMENEGILVVSIVNVPPPEQAQRPIFRTVTLLIDHYQSTYRATGHLISTLGHQRICYLAGPRTSTSNVAKRSGYLTALEEAELVANIIELPDGGQPSYSSGYEAAKAVMWQPEQDRPTALVCYSDELALGANAYFSERGIRVPEQISIWGNDGIKPAEYANPPLTTNELPKTSLAEAAVEIVHRYVNQQEYDLPAPVVPRAVMRQSTGRASNYQ